MGSKQHGLREQGRCEDMIERSAAVEGVRPAHVIVRLVVLVDAAAAGAEELAPSADRLRGPSAMGKSALSKQFRGKRLGDYTLPIPRGDCGGKHLLTSRKSCVCAPGIQGAIIVDVVETGDGRGLIIRFVMGAEIFLSRK